MSAIAVCQKKIQSQTARATVTTASRTVRTTALTGAGRKDDDSTVPIISSTAFPKLSRACFFTGSVQSLPCNCVVSGLVARSGRLRNIVSTIASSPQPVRADTTQTE